MSGFLFVTIIEIFGFKSSGVVLIITLIVLYVIGIGIIELFRRFWLRFCHAQECASAATCEICHSYGLFDVAVGEQPLYAKCEKCDHEWVIE
jgi:hypothetical protein